MTKKAPGEPGAKYRSRNRKVDYQPRCRLLRPVIERCIERLPLLRLDSASAADLAFDAANVLLHHPREVVQARPAVGQSLAASAVRCHHRPPKAWRTRITPRLHRGLACQRVRALPL